MKIILYFIVSISIVSCMKSENADTIYHNGFVTYSENYTLKQSEAIAIKNGKIIEIGPNRQILNKYKSEKEIDLKEKQYFPILQMPIFIFSTRSEIKL